MSDLTPSTTAIDNTNLANAGPEHRVISRVAFTACAVFSALSYHTDIPPTFDAMSVEDADAFEKKVLCQRSYPNNTPTELQESHIRDREMHGWKSGESYDAVKKIDPLLVPYALMSEIEKKKLALFMGIVTAMPNARPAQASQEPSAKGDLEPAKPALDLPESTIREIAQVAIAATNEYFACSNPQAPAPHSWHDGGQFSRDQAVAGVKAVLNGEPGSVVTDTAVWDALGYEPDSQAFSPSPDMIEEAGIFVSVVRALTQSF